MRSEIIIAMPRLSVLARMSSVGCYFIGCVVSVSGDFSSGHVGTVVSFYVVVEAEYSGEARYVVGSVVDAWAGVGVLAIVSCDVGLDVCAAYSVIYGIPLDIVLGEDY